MSISTPKCLPIIIFFFLLSSPTICQITQCSTYVSKLINDILDFKITSIPLPTLLYSGITPNNPGQINQCKSSNYSYFLVTIKNTTLMIQSYYGLCVPKQCTADDIQIALQFLRVRVYQDLIQNGNGFRNLDLVVKIGGGLIAGWICIVIGCSLWIYFKQPVINQYLVGQRQIKQIGNSQLTQTDHPSIQTFSQSREQQQYIFNYYQGYKKLFVSPQKPNTYSLILFLTIMSFAVSVQFSYRQNIAQNISQIPNYLNSAFGIFICNIQIALHTIIFIMGYRLAYSLFKIKKFVKIGRFFFDILIKKWVNLILMSLLVYSFCSLCISQPLVKIWNIKNAIDCKNYIWQIWFMFRNLQLDSKICLPWFSLLEVDLLFTLLSAPLIIIFRTSKRLGYFLLLILITVSLFISYEILKNQDVIFEPTKLMNSQKQYWIDYQGNAFVRLCAFSMGLFYGFFVTQALDSRGQMTLQSKITRVLGKSGKLQVGLGMISFTGMIICYGMLHQYLDIKRQNKQPFIYMIFTPFCFVISLGLLTLPSCLQLKSAFVSIFDKLLTKNRWIHLDRLSLNFYLIAPMIIAYTTYSSQNSINYNGWTVSIYLFGDLFITYFICILVTVLIENQLIPIVGWLREKIIGKQVQYGDILIQYM